MNFGYTIAVILISLIALTSKAFAESEKPKTLAPLDSELAISKSEWLHSFGENFSSQFCEKITERKNCKQLIRSECIRLTSESLAICAKEQSLPADIYPGLPSSELGLRLGTCASRKVELALIKKEVCKK